jgi:hypothetical protein
MATDRPNLGEPTIRDVRRERSIVSSRIKDLGKVAGTIDPQEAVQLAFMDCHLSSVDLHRLSRVSRSQATSGMVPNSIKERQATTDASQGDYKGLRDYIVGCLSGCDHVLTQSGGFQPDYIEQTRALAVGMRKMIEAMPESGASLSAETLPLLQQ